MSDPTFVESLRVNAKEVWQRGLDVDRLQAINTDSVTAAAAARAAGAAPDSEEAAAVVEAYLAGLAGLGGMNRDPRDPTFRAGVRQRFERQDPRASRYWELVGILNGRHPMSGHVADWRWIVEALLHRIPAPTRASST